MCSLWVCFLYAAAVVMITVLYLSVYGPGGSILGGGKGGGFGLVASHPHPLKFLTASDRMVRATATAANGNTIPCGRCRVLLHDYLEYSLQVSFRNKKEQAFTLHSIFLQEILADLREFFSGDYMRVAALAKCRRIEKKKGRHSALHYFFSIDPRLKATLDLWAMHCLELNLAGLKEIDTWVSHTIYEIFTIIAEFHEGHSKKGELVLLLEEIPFLEI